MGQTYDVLVWEDNFSVDGSLDSTKWWAQTQLPNGSSWYNGEIQHYTNRDTNASASGGSLHLRAVSETFTDQGHTKDYTSARLNSKFAFTYGRVEVRAILPTGVGTWPAIWMLGKNITEPGAYFQTQGYGTVPWPWCGEIDIMEHWGQNQDHVSSAIHTPSSFGGTQNVGGTMLPGASTQFHTYAMEWSPTQIEFSIDSVVHYTYQPTVQDTMTWPFDAPQFLLLNIAILPNIDTAFTQSTMEVDFVRVYQSSIGQDELEASSIEVFPNPATDAITLRHPYESAHVTLFDLQGREVIAQNIGAFDGHIAVNELPPGPYVLRLRNSKGDIVREERVVVR